ncbi:MAG: BsuPI-related putative proteinase inhibitor, partial [bacterium]|nr:BsuPI-related putative proteinase inhibitor [bacterium]
MQAEDGPNFFPTAVGMTWIYGGNPREIALTARVADVERTADGAVFFWEGFQGRRVVRQTVDGKVMELGGETWRLLFDLRAGEGASWTIEPFGMGDLLDGARVEVVSRSAEVRVPYATFQGAIHLKLISPNLADAGVTEVWFAKGVGLVKWVEQSIAGPQAYELAAFTNVVRVPDGFENVHAQRHDRFVVELATDREVYAAGDLVRVRYRLINISGGSVRLMFPSGQRYDLALDGQQGRVWQWSATRSFIQVLSGQNLGAEETFEFTEVFSLSETGAGPGDSFLLRGFLSVAPDEDGSAGPSETEGLVKFAVGGQVGGGLPEPQPLPPIETPTDAVKQETGRPGDF